MRIFFVVVLLLMHHVAAGHRSSWDDGDDRSWRFLDDDGHDLSSYDDDDDDDDDNDDGTWDSSSGDWDQGSAIGGDVDNWNQGGSTGQGGWGQGGSQGGSQGGGHGWGLSKTHVSSSWTSWTSRGTGMNRKRGHGRRPGHGRRRGDGRRPGHGRRTRCNNCLVCSSLGCEKCFRGYEKKLVGFRYHCRHKQACPVSHCERCTSPHLWALSFHHSCQRCQPGYFRFRYRILRGDRCVKSCPRGYKAMNGTRFREGPYCKQIPPKCPMIPGCSNCPMFDHCTACEVGLNLLTALYWPKCVRKCPRGFDSVTVNNSSVCRLRSAEGCYDRMCRSCKRGWHLLDYRGKLCHKQCPPGFYGRLQRCLKCSRTCEECSRPFKCDICKRGLSKLSRWRGEGRCVKNCPQGFSKVSVNASDYSVCRKVCNVANCAECNSISYHGDMHCDACRPGYHKIHVFRSLLWYEYNDKCVAQCPKGFIPRPSRMGGSECKKGRLPSSTFFPPTTPEGTPEGTSEATSTFMPRTTPEGATPLPESTPDLSSTNPPWVWVTPAGTTPESTPEVSTRQRPETTTMVPGTTAGGETKPVLTDATINSTISNLIP